MHGKVKAVSTAASLFLAAILFSAKPVLSSEINSGEDDEEAIELVLDEDGEEAVELAEEIEFIDDESGLEKMPEILEFVEADYPEEFIKDGVEGTVLLELLISETGGVDSVSVVHSLHPLLDTCAIEAVKKFKFSPAQAGGENVAVMLQYEYRFSLRDVISVPESYVNFSGRILERGTRRPVGDMLVALKFLDTLCSGADLPMPFSFYIEQIGKFEGQRLEDGLLVTETDSDGTFKFTSLPACKVQVSLVSPDYDLFISDEQIGKLEEVRATYYVKRTDYSDYELVVYGKAEEKEVSRRQLSVAEVKRIPGLGGDAVKVVQAMPGVARPSVMGTDVVVRGAPSWDSRFFVDGVSVPLLYHLVGSTSIYPSDALETIDFYPGGFSTRYGGAVAGVIEMKSRRSKTDRLQGYVDLSMLDGSIFVEGPINEKVSFMASGRRNFTGDLLNLYFNHLASGDIGFAVAPFYWDYLLRTDIAIDKNHHMFVSLLGSRDSLGLFINGLDVGSSEIGEATNSLNMKLMFHTLTAGLDSRINGRWNNYLRFSGTYLTEGGALFGVAKYESSLYLSHLRNQVSFTASDKVTVNAGADIELMNHDMILIIPSGQNLIMRDTTDNELFGVVGGYANVEWKPIDKLQLIPGIRYDYYPELDYKGSVVPAFWDYGIINNRRGASGEPSFRINGRYEIMDGHVAKAAVGSYSQTPEPIGQVIHPTWGEPDLPATKAAQYVIGHEWRISDILSLDAQTYFNRQWDVPRSFDTIDYDPNLEIQKLYLSDGKRRTYGLELMLRHMRTEKFFGWISYTLSRSERWDKARNRFVLAREDEPHHLQLLGSWSLKNDLDLGGRLRFVSGRPTTPIVGIVEDANSKSIRPIYGKPNSTRMDPFLQLDLRLDKKVIYEKWILSYYCDLQNVLWPIYRSPEFVFHNYNYTEKQTISMIPMMSFGVRAQF
ncbi:MAG: TonB-dependent receptor [Chitinispirillales bacterium]|jgi:TonB family protein|nr:TonB-dependent receptor [Chitinispirillales bacterium]